MKKHLLLAAIILCAGISLNAAEMTENKEETKQEEVLPVAPAPVEEAKETPAPVAKEEEKKEEATKDMEEVDLSDLDLDVEEPTE